MTALAVKLSEAEMEEAQAPEGYQLPEGWTWELVAERRAKWDVDPTHYPLVSVLGGTCWGKPLNP